jgi:hypothetical protein
MSKKVQKKPEFIEKNVKCANCSKRISGGYEVSNLFRMWSKYFCSINCANEKGYQESTNILYRIDKKIMGIK